MTRVCIIILINVWSSRDGCHPEIRWSLSCFLARPSPRILVSSLVVQREPPINGLHTPKPRVCLLVVVHLFVNTIRRRSMGKTSTRGELKYKYVGGTVFP